MAGKVGITQVSGKVIISYSEAKLIASYANAKGLTSSTFANVLATYSNLTAADIYLIARILDQEFSETVTMSESHAMTIAKALADTSTVSG